MAAMTEWDYKIFWDEVVRQFQEELSFNVFSMWFSTMDYEKSGENSVTVSVPSKFFEDQIKQKYKTAIEKKFLELSGKILVLEFIVKQKNSDETEKNEATPVLASEVKPQKKQEQKEKHPNLNAEYTFDNFIIGENNKFAASVAMASAKNPGTSYNPILIYGGVGLGKTHLMQALGNQIWRDSNLKMIYITAENFTNEFITALNQKSMSAFKNKYRLTDVLLIDDIHFFQG